MTGKYTQRHGHIFGPGGEFIPQGAVVDLLNSPEYVGESTPMSLRAFGSPDTLASYCINKGQREGVTEWKIVYDMLYSSRISNSISRPDLDHSDGGQAEWPEAPHDDIRDGGRNG